MIPRNLGGGGGTGEGEGRVKGSCNSGINFMPIFLAYHRTDLKIHNTVSSF